MQFPWASIKRDSITILSFTYRNHVFVFKSAMSPVCHFNYLYSRLFIASFVSYILLFFFYSNGSFFGLMTIVLLLHLHNP